MVKLDILTIFAVLGSAHGLFFSLVLMLKRYRSFSNTIFSLLLIVTSIRIAKNIVVHILMHDPELWAYNQIWSFLIYVGLSHQFAIGPLFLLYFFITDPSKLCV